MKDILPEGIGPVTETPADKFDGPPLKDQLAHSACLSDLAKDFVFFTPGLLFTHGELDRDPVQEFMNEAEGDPQIALLSFNRPVWDGFQFKDGRRDWNHKLLGIERARWPALLQFLGGVGILDSNAKTFYRALPFSIMIVDPVIADRASVLPAPVPMVEVVVFGLDGNKRKVLVNQTGAPGMQLPRVVTFSPDQRTVKFAKALLAGKNPVESPDPASASAFAEVQKAMGS